MSSDANIKSQIEKAVKLLAANEVVAMPTETVYGLAARIDSDVAIKKIFSTKERPFFDPLIVHVASVAQAKQCAASWNPMNSLLADAFWPGPLTQVVAKSDKISDFITSGLGSVGLRWPNHKIACQLIEMVGVPLAAPSANKFGRTSPTSAAHVKEEFGDKVFVVEDSAGQIGIESTVLSVKFNNELYELAVLRKGAVLRSDIDKVLEKSGLNFQWVDSLDKKESPGHMQHHYMPSVPLVICKDPKISFSDLSRLLKEKLNEMPDVIDGVKITKPKGEIKKIVMLKLSDKPEQAARELYSQLRSMSLRAPDALCFLETSVQSGEMWESVLDRLYKAASLILK